MAALHASLRSLATTLNNNIPLTLRQLLNLPLLLNTELYNTASHSFHTQQSCPNPPLLSCSIPSTTDPTPINTCCINQPAGHFLLAQFWDTSPPTGPNNSWTLHGLWPDYCAGGFPQSCDHTRDLSIPELVNIVNNASTINPETYGLLPGYMNEYWKGLSGDEDLWMHEWSKHGTCVSTIEPACYGEPQSATSFTFDEGLSSHQDLLDYFTAATTLHSTLQTFPILAAAGIVPSTTETYSLSAIQAALTSSHAGFSGTVKCNKRGEINEVWMHYTVLGPLRNFTPDLKSTEIFIPVAPDGLITTCPNEGIKYLPKYTDSKPIPTTIPKVPQPPTGNPFEGKGYLRVQVQVQVEDDAQHTTATVDQATTEGCLISKGSWYTSGTCATYRTTLSPTLQNKTQTKSFTLTSSAGPCTILSEDDHHGLKGEFICAADLASPSVFEAGGGAGEGDEGELLSWENSTVFYAERRPGKFGKGRVFVDDGDGERPLKLEIWWQGV